MGKDIRASILKTARDRKVRFVRLWFVDILGQLKSFTITGRELKHALMEGMGFDGSSIEGFARIYESDLIAMPDPSTFRIMPWKLDSGTTARMICNIITPEKTPYPGDTRRVLMDKLDEARKAGYEYFVGPELEFFYFKNDKSPDIVDEGGYFDTVPLDETHDFRLETMMMLEQMGVPVEYTHHEVANSQHEIDLRYADAMTMADRVITYKLVVKHVAGSHGLHASFMPKPITGINGNGMHVHQSLFKGGRNAFFDPKSKDFLSETARHFVAGILRHAREICVVTNQWVNSYKRLIPGYEAPVYISWGRRNRSALVRIPQAKLGCENATRIECRFPDPSCNPYLAFSIMLAAGLEGIKKKYPLPDSVEANIFEMNELERRAKRIETLPGSLIEAIETAEKSALLRNTFGEHVFSKFLENKRLEWDHYRTQVSDYEIKRYLPML